ncbi:hypothetical protein E3J49_05360 [Candidatus Bathyarchaeota archaeon]|nr:MAG: hypothetical protein E3J49_05360 [Candidatus Bathyarchaeota archaeon]
MEVQWKNRNIQLSMLVDAICRFFTERSFSVSSNDSGGKYSVVAGPIRFHQIAENIRVSVTGKPDDFTVEFAAGAHSRRLVMFGTLTSFFGGGSFSTKGAKSREALEKLEHEFWPCLTEKIRQLEDSSHRTGLP